MSKYTVETRWNRTSSTFGYEAYNRAHEIEFGSGTKIPASAAPEFRGETDRVNPEESFLAALSSCHMLTFLAIASRQGFTVETYVDHANCTLDRDEGGGFSIHEATLSPSVTFAGQGPTTEVLQKWHEKAHRDCFIARSVKTTVRVVPGS